MARIEDDYGIGRVNGSISSASKGVNSADSEFPNSIMNPDDKLISDNNKNRAVETNSRKIKQLEKELESKKKELEEAQKDRGGWGNFCNSVSSAFGGGDKGKLKEIEKLEAEIKALQATDVIKENPQVTDAIDRELQESLDTQKVKLQLDKEKRGWFGNGLNFVAEVFGGGDKGQEKKIEEQEASIASLKNDPDKYASAYKEMTGKGLSVEEVQTSYAVNEQTKAYEEFIGSNAPDDIAKAISPEGKQIIVENLEKQYAQLQGSFDKTKDENGWVGASWDWCKNLVGSNSGSNATQAEMDSLRDNIEKLKNEPENFAKNYEAATGRELSTVELAKNDVLGEYSDSLDRTKAAKYEVDYKTGQRQVVDTVATIGTVGTVTVLVAGGIIATPFTAGASLGAVAAGVGIAAGAGVAINVGVHALDAKTGGREYTLENGIKDAAWGAANGTLTLCTAGLGGPAAQTGKTIGMNAAKTTALTVAGEGTTTIATTAATQSVAQTLKTGLTQAATNGLTKIGLNGAVAQVGGRMLGATAQGIIIGGGSGGAYAGTNYLINSEDRTVDGFFDAVKGGAIAGATIAGTTSFAGEVVSIAKGAPKPVGTTVEKVTVKDGIEVKQYWNGNDMVAFDIKASDLQKLNPDFIPDSVLRTVRVTPSQSTAYNWSGQFGDSMSTAEFVNMFGQQTTAGAGANVVNSNLLGSGQQLLPGSGGSVVQNSVDDIILPQNQAIIPAGQNNLANVANQPNPFGVLPSTENALTQAASTAQGAVAGSVGANLPLKMNLQLFGDKSAEAALDAQGFSAVNPPSARGTIAQYSEPSYVVKDANGNASSASMRIGDVQDSVGNISYRLYVGDKQIGAYVGAMQPEGIIEGDYVELFNYKLPADYVKAIGSDGTITTSKAYHVQGLRNMGDYRGVGTQLMQKAVLESIRLGGEGRLWLDAVAGDYANGSPTPFYWKLGLRFANETQNIKFENWLKSGGDLDKLPNGVKGGQMYLPKENINQLMEYGTSLSTPNITSPAIGEVGATNAKNMQAFRSTAEILAPDNAQMQEYITGLLENEGIIIQTKDEAMGVMREQYGALDLPADSRTVVLDINPGKSNHYISEWYTEANGIASENLVTFGTEEQAQLLEKLTKSAEAEIRGLQEEIDSLRSQLEGIPRTNGNQYNKLSRKIKALENTQQSLRENLEHGVPEKMGAEIIATRLRNLVESSDRPINIIIPDDCSLSGSSMLCDTIRILNDAFGSEAPKNGINVIFSPMIEGAQAQTAFESFINPLNPDNGFQIMSDAQKTNFLKSISALTTREKPTFSGAVEAFENIANLDNIKFSVTPGTKMAKHFASTDYFKSLPADVQWDLEALITGAVDGAKTGIFKGYHDCGVLVVTPTQDYILNGETYAGKVPTNSVGIMELAGVKLGIIADEGADGVAGTFTKGSGPAYQNFIRLYGIDPIRIKEIIDGNIVIPK